MTVLQLQVLLFEGEGRLEDHLHRAFHLKPYMPRAYNLRVHPACKHAMTS